MTHLPRYSVMHLMAKYICEHQRQRKGRFSWGRFRQRKFWLTKSEHLQELLSFSLCAKDMLSCSFLPQDNTLVHNVVRVKLSPRSAEKSFRSPSLRYQQRTKGHEINHVQKSDEAWWYSAVTAWQLHFRVTPTLLICPSMQKRDLQSLPSICSSLWAHLYSRIVSK